MINNEMSPFEYIDSIVIISPKSIWKYDNPQGEHLSAFCIKCELQIGTILQHYYLSTTSDTCEFDVIGITEIFKIHTLQSNIITGSSSGRGGVGMYIKDHLDFKHIL